MDAATQAPAEVRRTVGAVGMLVFLVTDGMSFFGLLLGYAYLRVQSHGWPTHRLAVPFTAALTAALFASSVTLSRAHRAFANKDTRRAQLWLAATLALGALFLVGQAREWLWLVRGHGAGLRVDQMWSSFFVVTGFHALHVACGLVLLTLCLHGVRRARLSVGFVDASALFWHFVDLVWLVVFASVYLT